MIPAWYALVRRANTLERSRKLNEDDERRLHAAVLALERTREALGKQHPMDQTDAYRRLRMVYDLLSANVIA